MLGYASLLPTNSLPTGRLMIFLPVYWMNFVRKGLLEGLVLDRQVDSNLGTPNSSIFMLGVPMREAMNGGPQTRRTNSVAVVGLIQSHLHDWIVLFGLLVLDRALAIIHPFKRFIGEYMLDDIRYPHKANTVPFWAVLVIAVFIPIFFTVLMYLKQRDVRDLHHAILGLLFSVLLSAVITDAVKDGVGRPRPDFFWRCFPDGHAIFKNVTGEVVCHGDPKAIQEGHRSFPSGHTSWSFGGLGFLSLYLAGKISLIDMRGHVAKLIIVFFPLVVATFVGISRVNDYKHHWQDVFAGALLGLTMSTLCHRQFFPAIHNNHCTWPSTIFEISNNADVLTLAQNQQGYHSPLPVNSTISDVEMGRSVESQHTGD